MPTTNRTVTTQGLCSTRNEFPRDLNISHLIRILENGPISAQEAALTVNNEKKRVAPDTTGPRKRARINNSSMPLEHHEASPEVTSESHSVQIYTHIFKLDCTRRGGENYEVVVDDGFEDERDLQKEAELVKILTKRSEGRAEPCTFDLGEFSLREDGRTIQLCASRSSGEVYAGDHLLTLPSAPFTNSDSGSVLYTCWNLQQSGHVSMAASASSVFMPDKLPLDPLDLPVQINVTISVSLNVPNIFHPQVYYVPSSFSVADRRRQFLTHLFCPLVTNPERFTEEIPEEVAIRHFYSMLKPAPPVSSTIIDALQPQGLLATLLPFQKRSVKWLLEREFKTIDAEGQIIPIPEAPDALPLFWERVNVPKHSGDEKGHISAPSSDDPHEWYYNRLTGSLSDIRPTTPEVAGAMLCEEMGLGKTLECLALILLSPMTNRDPSTIMFDEQTKLEIGTIKTNLIVTPSTLSQQWLDEISRHAPSLHVLFYNGYNKIKLPKPDKIDVDEPAGPSRTRRIWCSYFHSFDVVITTYKTLQEELAVAKAPLERPKRKAASYSYVERIRSPLVRAEWARVFMDEVQLVGGGKTAEMVGLIPRNVSIAVSGTPARSKVADLSHVLRFLGVEDAIATSKTWDRLLKPESRDLLAQIFERYAIRTLKSSVRKELTIPSQTRFAIGIELGKVERHIYDETLHAALDDLGVDARGVAASAGWEIDIGSLRTWLRRLRQICIHPQVGALQYNKSTTKATGAATIKTMQEVLQDWRAKTWQSLTLDHRSKIQLSVRLAQLLQKIEEDPDRYYKSRALLLGAQTETNQLVEDIKAAIAEHDELGRQIKDETLARRRALKQFAQEASLSKGKGKQKDTATESTSDDDSEDDIPRTRVGEEYRAKQRNLLSRLREGYVLQHKVSFLLGDVYHLLGSSYSQDEDTAYASAEAIRRLLLKHAEDAAASSMSHLSRKSRDSLGVSKKDLKLSLCEGGGIWSSHVMEETNDVLNLLNKQADLLWEWRARIFTLLTEKVSAPEGQAADGEEYSRALDTQGELEAYLQAYAALLADRKEGMIAERTILATHDAREVKSRDTFAARKAVEPMTYEEDNSDVLDENLQDIVMQQQLVHVRNALRQKHGSRALKTMMFELTEISRRVGGPVEETQIAREEAKRIRDIIANQGRVMEKLELELGLFRKVFNDRIQYFRQLQELSDTVMEVQWDGDVRDVIKSAKMEEDKLILSVNRKRAQARHLSSLARDQEEGDLDEARDCILCRCAFQVGLITACAHIFCERCLREWMKAKHDDCPVCRSRISTDTLQRISLNQDKAKVHQNTRKLVWSPTASDRSIRFNSLPQETLDEIQTFEAHGSYGSKIMHLVRHLLYLQGQEPGTKSVVFSAWSDSLTIIEQALLSNGIHCIRVDKKGKRNAAQLFKEDPDILVFLLHGERENAGLNLTCAKRVWLIEPTVNHFFEVQAISRVDRMGQTASTEVYCYYIEDTVEENILRMGAKRGFSLYVEDHSADDIDLSDFFMGNRKVHVDSPTSKMKQKGDFIEKADDMIHVLFPHLDYQNTDFTNPGEDDVFKTNDVKDGLVMENQGAAGSTNAVAGPSRLTRNFLGQF